LWPDLNLLGFLAIFRDDRRQRLNGPYTDLAIFRRKPRAINMFTTYTKSRFHVYGMTQNRTYLTETTRVAMYTWLCAPCRLNFGAKPMSGIQESTEAGRFADADLHVSCAPGAWQASLLAFLPLEQTISGASERRSPEGA
jgi:hypothetical protein